MSKETVSTMFLQVSILLQIPIFRVTAILQDAGTDKMILRSIICIKIISVDIKSRSEVYSASSFYCQSI